MIRSLLSSPKCRGFSRNVCFAVVWFSAVYANAVGTMVWENREGNTFEAEMVDFNSDAKSVSLRDAQGRIYQVPVANLSLNSKVQVWGEVASLMEKRKISPGELGASTNLGLGIFIVVYIAMWILGILMSYLCFRRSASILTLGGEGHLLVFLKASAAYIITGIIASAVLIFLLFTAGLAGWTGGSALGIFMLLVGVGLVVMFWIPIAVTMRGYGINALRAIGIWILSGIFSTVISLVFWVVVWIVFDHIPVGDTHLGEWIFDEFFFKPMGIL